jgi:hypothetical protein
LSAKLLQDGYGGGNYYPYRKPEESTEPRDDEEKAATRTAVSPPQKKVATAFILATIVPYMNPIVFNKLERPVPITMGNLLHIP